MGNQKPKHTPGPWEVRKSGMRNTQTYIAGETEIIAEVYSQLDSVLTEGRNARLIAAAPDLLAALEYAVELLANNEPFDENDQAILERAISKARGRDK